MKTTLLLLLLISISNVHARLDESPMELEKRFGKGTISKGGRAPAEEQMRFEKNGYSINVDLHWKKAVMIQYSKQSGSLTDSEIKEIQSVNSPFKEEWKPIDGSSKTIFVRADRPAYCKVGQSEITFYSEEYWNKNYGKSYSTVAPSTKGF